MKILIVPNSFKGSLSSVQISKIISEIFSERFEYEIFSVPLSDGGDGFLDVIEYHSKERLRKYSFELNFDDKSTECSVLFSASTKTVYIESAEVIGLKKISSKDLKPLYLNSSALGDLLNKISNESEKDTIPFFEKIIIGIGGTATIDLGLGALEKLGLQLLDESNNPLKVIPINFSKARKIIPPQEKFQREIVCVVDVQTKLFGKENAIDIFGPQKGANENDLIIIKKGMENIFELLNSFSYQIDKNNLNGAGGGLAAGLNIFLNAEIVSAEDFIKENFLGKYLNEHFDYIVTTEGKFDIQSFQGKVTGEIIKMFNQIVKKIFVVCGNAEKDVMNFIPRNVEVIELNSFFGSIEESIKNSSYGLKLAFDRIIEQVQY